MKSRTLAIILILICLLLAACLLLAGITAEAEADKPCALPEGLPWATVMQTAATHAGPGLRFEMTGMISAGHAVEVLRMQDGWAKCWCWQSTEPVWICGEYLVLEQ